MDFPTLEKSMQEKPTLENPTQLNKDILSKEQSITDISITHSLPIRFPQFEKHSPFLLSSNHERNNGYGDKLDRFLLRVWGTSQNIFADAATGRRRENTERVPLSYACYETFSTYHKTVQTLQSI